MKKRLMLSILVASIVLAGCSSNDGQTQTSTSSSTNSSATTTSSSASTQVSTQLADGLSVTISQDEAQTIAIEHAGVNSGDVVFYDTKIDYDDGRQVYEIEFSISGDTYQEYDYEIDATTGEIISYDYEAENLSNPQLKTDDTISEDEVKRIMLEQVSGASESDIKKLKLDTDDGLVVYEGKIIYNEKEYEFDINATTGVIISQEVESIYD